MSITKTDERDPHWRAYAALAMWKDFVHTLAPDTKLRVKDAVRLDKAMDMTCKAIDFQP